MLRPLALCLGLTIAASGPGPDDNPLYEGKTLKEWVKNLKAPDTRAEAMATLAGAGAEAVPTLITALKSSDVATRAAAAETLGQIGTAAKDAVPGLMALLRDRTPGV